MTPPPETETGASAPTGAGHVAAGRILFVGGTGRSGTHIVAKLVGRSERYRLFPMECRFHVDEDGFPGLLAGGVSKRDFLRRMRGHWWRRLQGSRIRGLHRHVSRERLDRALAAFDRRFDDQPEAACAELFLDLIWPQRPGVAGPDDEWQGVIEQSCDTIAQAPTLLRLFPRARFIHVVRDGRDASASRVGQARWLPYPGAYPRTRVQGLEWWEHRIRRIDRGAAAIPGRRLIEIELGELLIRDTGRRQVRRIARLAGVRDEFATLKKFARRRMNPELANEERWRRGLGERRQREIEARYAEILDRLEADGVSCAPLLRRAYERTAGSD